MTLPRLLLAGALALVAPAATRASTIPTTGPLEAAADSIGSPDSLVASTDSMATAEPVAPAPATAPAKLRRNIGQRVGRAATNFGRDVLHVATSPARLTPMGLAQLAAVVGVEAAIYANDQEIMDAAQRNHDAPVLHPIHKLGDILEDAGFMPHTLEAEGGVWLIGGAFHSETTQEICQELMEAHLIGGGIRNALKVLVGRAHPFEGRGPRVYEFGKGTSFPSGHTSIYYEAATILSMHARSQPVTVLLYGLATAGAIQRVQARAHWASDVFPPIVSGILIGHVVVNRNRERIEKAQWTPAINAAGDGVRIGIQRRF